MTAALLAATSGTAWAAPGESGAERPVRVKVDVSAISAADGPHIERFTHERIESLLEERSLVTSDEAEDAIEIRVDYVDAEDLEYAIYVEVYDDGEKVEPGIDWFVCKFCPQGMVADTIAKELPAALDLLDQAVPDDEAGGGEVESSVRPSGEGASIDEPVKPIGWLGISGAVIAGGGVGLIVGGAVQLARGEVEDPSQTSEQRVTDYRPQGRVLLGVGLGAVALGATGLIVDVVVRKKKREALAVHPTWGPRGAGIAITGRF